MSTTLDAAASSNTAWQRAFLLPTLRTERIGDILAVYASTQNNAGKFFDFEIEQKWLYTNATTIAVEYVYRAPESLWPGYFEEFIAEALAAKLAMPITEIEAKARYHQEMAYGTPGQGGEGGLFAAAKMSDIRSQPTTSLIDDSDPITAARFGGHGRGVWW